MTIMDELVLPADVSLAPVEQLAADLQGRLACAPGSFTVTRRGARAASSVVDGAAARLLERFRSPITVVDAVVEFARTERLDPRATLDDAFGVLSGLINDGILVSARSPRAEPITTSLCPGDSIGGFEVVEAVHVVVDTEVYRVRTGDGGEAALKLARAGSEAAMVAGLAHEAAVLRLLAGRAAPRLLATGEHRGRPWLAVSWCAGADVVDAATQARATGERAVLLALVDRVLAAYAGLHGRGVLHGDVHPRNLLVDGTGAVTVVDFGLAAAPGLLQGSAGGVDLFLAPEHAASRLAGAAAPAPSAAAEQYALAAVAYLLVTGTHTHEFALERDVMLRQLRDEPPAAFAAAGCRAVERVLRRALAKEPAARYRSVATLRSAFRRAMARDLGAPPPRRRAGAGPRLVEDVLARMQVPGELFPEAVAPPTASVMNGAAGFAYALLRIAAIRADPLLLATADLWSSAAVRACGRPGAFESAELRLGPHTIGERSFYHHEAGVHAVHALVAAARDDHDTAGAAVRAFVAAAGRPCPHLDVTFGRSGLLLGCAQLVAALPGGPALTQLGDGTRDGVVGAGGSALTQLGWELRDGIDAQLAGQPDIASARELPSLGAAHGWAGYLYAVLRWAAVTGEPPSTVVVDRLGQLATLGQWRGRAVYWPSHVGAPLAGAALAASWCNGAAGYVPLWTLAAVATGEERFGRLAAAAAWAVYGDDGSAPGDLCCGYAGRAHALAAMYRHTGERDWLAMAGALAERSAERVRAQQMRRDSLYKGEQGVALLVAELTGPVPGGMPLYEPLG